MLMLMLTEYNVIHFKLVVVVEVITITRNPWNSSGYTEELKWNSTAC